MRKPHRRRNLTVAIALLVVLGVGGGGYWLAFMRGIVFSDDARIAGDLVDIAPRVGGLVTALRVHEGDAVQKDEVLFELDNSAYTAAQERAQAAVAAAQARLDMARAENDKALHGPRSAEIRIAVAAKESAEAQSRLATTSWERAKILFEKGVLSDPDRLQAQTAWERATRSLAEAEDRLNLLYQGTRSEDLTSAHANVERAEADLAAARANAAQAQLDLEHTQVRAPFRGVVVRKWRDPGATVGVGTPVLTLLDPSTLHVAANINEKDLAGIRVGDKVDVTVDAYPDVTLPGRVRTILQATNSQFGLIPAEGVTGTFVKVAQRVPLRIALDSPPDKMQLGPGLSVEIRVHTGSATPEHPAVSSRD